MTPSQPFLGIDDSHDVVVRLRTRTRIDLQPEPVRRGRCRRTIRDGGTEGDHGSESEMVLAITLVLVLVPVLGLVLGGGGSSSGSVVKTTQWYITSYKESLSRASAGVGSFRFVSSFVLGIASSDGHPCVTEYVCVRVRVRVCVDRPRSEIPEKSRERERKR
jgi:hypothetical protein